MACAARLVGVAMLLLITESAVATSRIIGPDYEVYNSQSDKSMRSIFEDWVVAHSKLYRDSEEKEERFGVFKQSLKLINDHNLGTSTHKLGLNQFADLTRKEFKALHLKSAFKPTASQSTAFRYANVTPPAAMDWRAKGAVTPIKDQGQCGSCWAFSTIGSTEGIHQIKTGKLVSLSEQELVSCDVTANTMGCNGATSLDYGFEFIVKNGGIDTEKDYPYTADDSTCNRVKTKKVAATITGHEDVPTNSEMDLEKALANQPITVGVDAESWQLYSKGIFSETCGVEVDHGVVAVGYGTSKQGEDFWIVKNSWGLTWGEAGYIRLKRNINSPAGMCGIATMPVFPTLD